MTEFLPMQTLTSPFAKVDIHVAEARQAAQKLEATFLAEMLKAVGFGMQTNSFSGGVGEDQFVSFHRQAIADQIAKSGGLGLAEHIFESIVEKNNA